MQTSKPDGAEWDISVLINGKTDEDLTKELQRGVDLAKDLEAKYKSNVSEDKVLEILQTLESIYMDLYDIYAYASLTLAADQTNKEAKELLNKVQTSFTKISSSTVFIDLELGKLLELKPVIINKPELNLYRHYLEKILRKVPHQLSESEEQIIIEKNQYGINEWSRFKANKLATQKFTVTIDGEEKEVSWSTGYKYFSSKIHEQRLEAVKKILGGLGKEKEFYATALRAICGNHVLEAKRRKYTILESSCIANDIEESMLEKMFSVIEKNIPLFHEFLRYKAKLYGTEKLRGEDLDGPYPIETGGESISWEEAKKMVFESFNNFDPEIGSFISDMYEKNRIDSLQKPAKVSGAFCSTWSKGKSAFILQSFNNNIDSVATLAHEQGHGVHAYLATRAQNLLSQRYPMVIAEAASEMGSMLFIEHFLSQSTDNAVKKKLLYQSVEDLMIVIFEVGSRFRFEQYLYQAIEDGEYLSPDKIDELFWKARNLYFGDAISWHPEQAYHWIWKPHYYGTGLRFYNYPYVFAEMIVLAMYNKYKNEGTSFVPKYKKFLASGGSKSPKELTAEMGFDLTSENFWESGLNEVKRLFEELKALN